MIGRNTLRPTESEMESSALPSAELHIESLPESFNQNLPEWNPLQNQPTDVIEKEDIQQEIKLAQAYLRPFIANPLVTARWKYYHGPLLDFKLHLFYEYRVCVSSEESLSICAETHNQSNDIWRRERRMRITASECYDLYTYYLNYTGDRDWNKKLSSILHPLEKRLPPLLYGKQMEGHALDCYRKKNPGKNVIRMGLVIPPSAPFLGCSPDAVVVDDAKLIEIKCPFSGKDKCMSEMIEGLKWIEKKTENYTLRKKHAYYGQVQLGMCLTRTKSTDLVIYSAYENDYFLINVPYDSNFIAKMFPVLREIYFNIFLPMLCAE